MPQTGQRGARIKRISERQAPQKVVIPLPSKAPQKQHAGGKMRSARPVMKEFTSHALVEARYLRHIIPDLHPGDIRPKALQVIKFPYRL